GRLEDFGAGGQLPESAGGSAQDVGELLADSFCDVRHGEGVQVEVGCVVAGGGGAPALPVHEAKLWTGEVGPVKVAVCGGPGDLAGGDAGVFRDAAADVLLAHGLAAGVDAHEVVDGLVEAVPPGVRQVRAVVEDRASGH